MADKAGSKGQGSVKSGGKAGAGGSKGQNDDLRNVAERRRQALEEDSKRTLKEESKRNKNVVTPQPSPDTEDEPSDTEDGA